MSDMRAKMLMIQVEQNFNGPNGEQTAEGYTFRAVGARSYDDTGKDENNTYALYTPCADLHMTVTNPTLFNKFKEGTEFYLDFTVVPTEDIDV